MAALNLKSKFLGCMIGSALGDALGELAFRYRHKQSLIFQLQKLPKLRYTDDTAMAIGLAESIIKSGGLDLQNLGTTFKDNFQKEPWRGYGPGPPIVFTKATQTGLTYAEAAQTLFGGQGSFGNGAAMRVAPAGLFFYSSSNLYQMASLSASVTHAHPLGRDGAAVQAKAVSLAVNLSPEKSLPCSSFLKSLINFAQTQELKEKLKMIEKLIETDLSPSKAAQQLGRSVAVHESLPFAIYSFLRNNRSFQECVFCAILNGGDRDTLGAMAGAISGAYLGIESIPQFWREKLENKEYIENLALKLFQMK